MKITELIDIIEKDALSLHGKPVVTVEMLGAIIRNLQAEGIIRKAISYGTILRAARKIKPVSMLPGSPAFYDARELAKMVDQTKKTRITKKEVNNENNLD